MSVLFSDINLRFVDHRGFITNIYKKVNNELGENLSLTFTKKLFCIKSITNHLAGNRKRSRDSHLVLEEVAMASDDGNNTSVTGCDTTSAHGSELIHPAVSLDPTILLAHSQNNRPTQGLKNITREAFLPAPHSSKKVMPRGPYPPSWPRQNREDPAAETMKIKQMYNKLLSKLPSEIRIDICKKYDLSETSLVRESAKNYFESTIFDHHGLSGGNHSDVPLKCRIKDDYFLIPQYSSFFCGSIEEQIAKLNGNKFDILIADPPWWNKYIRRLKGANDKLSYSMMYNEEIASIPVKNLLSENCLIAVWCTNAPSNIDAIKNLIFPKWGVQYVTMWYWLKLTVDLKPLCEFGSGCRKQPYERIVIGRIGNVHVPSDLLVASVPSALHSHKPPLLDLLTPCIDAEKPQILELFARYLLPSTTSVGYEPLKWQHLSLYEEAVDTA